MQFSISYYDCGWAWVCVYFVACHINLTPQSLRDILALSSSLSSGPPPYLPFATGIFKSLFPGISGRWEMEQGLGAVGFCMRINATTLMFIHTQICSKYNAQRNATAVQIHLHYGYTDADTFTLTVTDTVAGAKLGVVSPTWLKQSASKCALHFAHANTI